MILQTAIFGGSFNPIHHGHLLLAHCLLKHESFDEIWFMVSPQNPLKRHEDLLDDNERLEMVRRALAGEKKLIVSDYEFHLPRPSYMWNTLQSLSAAYPERSFTLFIGSDNWQRFNHWYEHDRILAHYNIIIYPREDSPIDKQSLPSNVSILDTPLINISSTEVRERLMHGEDISDLVPPAVAEYIKDRRLYMK